MYDRMRQFNKKIGILGGVGPLASAHALLKIVQYAQQIYGAVEDTDYPEIFLRSVFFQGFGKKGIEDKSLIKDKLFNEFSKFSEEGVEVALIACNSLHSFYTELQILNPNIKIINLPQEGAEEIACRKYKRIAVLGSESSRYDHLHKQALEPLGIEIIPPNKSQSDLTDELIYKIMGGSVGANEIKTFQDLCTEFKNANAEAVLSGCTELSIISDISPTVIPVVDCLHQSLAKALKISRSP